MDGQIKPGWQTTEFWLALIPQVPVMVGAILGQNNPKTVAIAAAASIVYALVRAYVKGQALQTGLVLAQAAADAAKAPQDAPKAS